MSTGGTTIDRLVELGFTHYEARAYVGLLGAAPMTGYALSNATGIPQPKVYETLRRLARKGAAVALPGEPARFAAVPPTQLLAQLEMGFRRRLADAEVGLMRDFGPAERELRVFESLQSFETIERRAVELLDEASRHVHVSLNCDEPGKLIEAVRRADARGVHSDVLHFDKEPLEMKNGVSVRHASTDGVVYRHHQARHLALVVDGSKLLWALAADGKDWEAVSGDDALFAAAIKGYVRHDIYVQQICQDFGELLEGRYGPGLAALVVARRENPVETPAASRQPGRRRLRPA